VPSVHVGAPPLPAILTRTRRNAPFLIPSPLFPLADWDQGWQQIKAGGIDRLISILDSGFDRTTKAFTHAQYMAVYNTCYKMGTQRTPQNLSEPLYEKHGECFKEYLSGTVYPALRSKRDIYLLQELSSRWSNHDLMNSWMYKFFQYIVSWLAGRRRRRG
jgi:hypothetical protein